MSSSCPTVLVQDIGMGSLATPKQEGPTQLPNMNQAQTMEPAILIQPATLAVSP